MPDEYRDLKLSVLFCGAGDVRIIAEVQIHDAVLYALKLKVQRGSAGHGLSPLTQAASKGCSVLFHSANEVLLDSAGGRLAMEGRWCSCARGSWKDRDHPWYVKV